jgi:putative ABC transport system substrate-binding protein
LRRFSSDHQFPEAEAELKVAQTASEKLGTRLLILKAVDEFDLEAAFVRAITARAKAFLIASDPNFYAFRHKLISLAAQHSIPTIYFVRDFAVAGGLMSYGASLADAYRQAGVYTGRILKGEKPADLPVMHPTKYELVINLKTAKALGLDMPASVLARAEEVIE